jgi:hypothetical protein
MGVTKNHSPEEKETRTKGQGSSLRNENTALLSGILGI